jgi:hypothetical protein
MQYFVLVLLVKLALQLGECRASASKMIQQLHVDEFDEVSNAC